MQDLEDLRWIAKRAEVARWVYTHFTEENALNWGTFGAMKPSPSGDRADGAGGSPVSGINREVSRLRLGVYLVGDGYWMSDWSYEHAPDYNRAAAIYRQALASLI